MSSKHTSVKVNDVKLFMKKYNTALLKRWAL